ncbi:DUF1737 domain-containing protein [Hoeflea sp.]|uniref:DUF1737 domain-containing protein n=1 Tax=Hoeflea sp. TaxID=1940281 RepID=UPI003B01BF63
MKLYRLLTGPDDASFCHKVSEALSNGWELHGDPAYGYNNESEQMQCAQAVIKHVSGETYSPDMKLSEQ